MNSLIILNGYGFDIISDNSKRFVYRKGNYYSLYNNTNYKIRLMNNHGVRTDAYIWIGNQKVGIWRINPYSSIVIESPVDSDELFTFKERDNNLIRVEFRSELISDDYTPPINSQSSEDEYFCPQLKYPICSIYTDTVTPYGNHRVCALSDDSYERYILNRLSTGYKIPSLKSKKVNKLKNIDVSNITVIYARLVPKHNEDNKIYTSMKDIKIKDNNQTTIPEEIYNFSSILTK